MKTKGFQSTEGEIGVDVGIGNGSGLAKDMRGAAKGGMPIKAGRSTGSVVAAAKRG